MLLCDINTQNGINLNGSFKLHGQQFALLIQPLVAQWSLPFFSEVHVILDRKQYITQIHAINRLQ